MSPLSDSEFSAKFFKAATPLEKIKLAIEEGRFSTWDRLNKPNIEDEYLLEVLNLPANHPVKAKPRKSGDTGLPQVYETTYAVNRMGQPVSIYFKGFFETEGGLVLELIVQSLRKDE